MSYCHVKSLHHQRKHRRCRSLKSSWKFVIIIWQIRRSGQLNKIRKLFVSSNLLSNGIIFTFLPLTCIIFAYYYILSGNKNLRTQIKASWMRKNNSGSNCMRRNLRNCIGKCSDKYEIFCDSTLLPLYFVLINFFSIYVVILKLPEKRICGRKRPLPEKVVAGNVLPETGWPLEISFLARLVEIQTFDWQNWIDWQNFGEKFSIWKAILTKQFNERTNLHRNFKKMHRWKTDS